MEKMKRIAGSGLLLTAVFLSFTLPVSCSKTPEKQEPPTATPVEESSAETVPAVVTGTFVIRPEAGFYSIENETEAVLNETLVLGEQLSPAGEKRKAVYDGNEQEFMKVKRQTGNEGWVRVDQAIENCTLGIVTGDKAFVYSLPQSAGATGTVLPERTIAAVLGPAETNDAFLKITAYDPASQQAFTEKFLRKEELSTSGDDVQTGILLYLASTSGDESKKEALLRSALADYMGSRYVTSIEEILAEMAAPRENTREIQPFVAVMLSAEDNVDIRDIPDEVNGKVLGRLAKDQKVEIDQSTRSDYTVGESTAPWYRITSPEGWVFGGFLKLEE